MQRSFRVGSVGVIAMTLAACGDGGSGGGGFGPFEGIYEITAHTENTAGCDVEGPSVLGNNAPMLASVQIEFFVAALTLHPCDDLADCQAVAADAKANNVFTFGDGFTFDSVTSGGSVANGTMVFAGGASGSSGCMGTVTKHTLTRAEDGSIRIESRTTPSGPYPEDAEGFCTTDGARAAAEGQACTELVAIDANLIDSI